MSVILDKMITTSIKVILDQFRMVRDPFSEGMHQVQHEFHYFSTKSRFIYSVSLNPNLYSSYCEILEKTTPSPSFDDACEFVKVNEKI